MKLYTIKEAIDIMLPNAENKAQLARDIGVEPIMINNYLKGKTRNPQKRVCVEIYKKHNLVVMPYSEDELREEIENDD